MHKQREEAMTSGLSLTPQALLPCAPLRSYYKHMELRVYDQNPDSSSAPAGWQLKGINKSLVARATDSSI